MEKLDKLKRISNKNNFIWNFIGTTFNAFNSLFFMIIVTRVNGLEESGIFTMAFSLACLFCLIGGYEGRVFQVTDSKEQFSDKEYIVHRIITCFITCIVVILYCFTLGYTKYKFVITVLLCLMKILEVLADVFYGILQKNDCLYIVGKSLFYKSIGSIFVFTVVDILTKNLLLSCIALNIVWFGLFIFYDLPNAKCFIEKNKKIKIEKVMGIFKAGFFSFSILFLAVYLVNAPKYALDGVVSSSLQAVYGIILLPATFLSMAVQYLLQPILTHLTQKFKDSDKKGFNKIILLILSVILALGIICLILAFFLGIPVLNLLYGVNIIEYRTHLMFIIVGAVFYSMSTLLSAALTTIRYTFIQFIVFSITCVFGFVVSSYLIHSLSIFGASLAYLLIMLLQFFLYVIAYSVTMKRIDFKVKGNQYD